MNPYYPNLLSPLQVGALQLRNRICLAPMSWLQIEHDKGYTRRAIDFTERIAKGGTGLVTLGEACVCTQTGSSESYMIRITDPSVFHSLCEMAEAVHRHGAAISIEASHAGALCVPQNNQGNLPMGPSAYVKPTGVPVREMTLADMEAVSDAFADSAATLQKAGFDMMMFHAGHGWLIHQFLSPRTNHRTDSYGGSRENRVRFPVMCLEKIRSRVGPKFALDMRMSGNELTQGGYDTAEAVELAKLLAPYVDSIQVSGGGIFAPDALRRMCTTIFFPHGDKLEYATAIKEAVNIPVSTVGGYADPDFMEQILKDGKADAFVLARGLIAEPDLVNKIARGEAKDAYRCMRCMECHGRLYTKGWLKCTINPTAGMPSEDLYRAQRPTVARKVVVVGGGPGGMQAALTAAQRGHDVTLVEKAGELGGTIRFADHVSFKAEMAYWNHQMQDKLSRTSVKVVLNQTASKSYIDSLKPDVLIIAVGANPLILPVPGLKDAVEAGKVLLGASMHLDPNVTYGRKVVIIGGGLVGCETAIDLKSQGREVTVVEMLPQICSGTTDEHMLGLNWAIQGVDIRTSTRCLAVQDSGVLVQTPAGDEELLPADTIILSAGLRSPTALVEELRQCVAAETIVIGDAARPRKMGDAIYEGYNAAMDL